MAAVSSTWVVHRSSPSSTLKIIALHAVSACNLNIFFISSLVWCTRAATKKENQTLRYASTEDVRLHFWLCDGFTAGLWASPSSLPSHSAPHRRHRLFYCLQRGVASWIAGAHCGTGRSSLHLCVCAHLIAGGRWFCGSVPQERLLPCVTVLALLDVRCLTAMVSVMAMSVCAASCKSWLCWRLVVWR